MSSKVLSLKTAILLSLIGALVLFILQQSQTPACLWEVLASAANYDRHTSQLLHPHHFFQSPSDEPDHLPSPSATRDCAISRTPGQQIMFEQSLTDFKRQHPSLPILILLPVADSSGAIFDMTSQLIQAARLLGESRVLLAYAMEDATKNNRDGVHKQSMETSRTLHSAKVLHRMQYTNGLDTWIDRALFGYMIDFDVAVIVRGVICASDLIRLIMQTINNSADLTCAVDISFDSDRRPVMNEGNIDISYNRPISSKTLLRTSRKFIQARCCDSSVKVIRLRSLRPAGPLPYDCPQILASQPQSTLARPVHPHPGEVYTPKIMISPSVKASSNPDDFRSAMQLGYMDLQGYDYRAIEWKEI